MARSGNPGDDARTAGVAATLLLLIAPFCPAQFHPPPLREKEGKIRASAYIQLRYTGIEDGDDYFALRRSKLMLGGDLNKDFQWYSQLFFKYNTPGPNDGRLYFQEGWIRFRRWKSIQFVAGQFKPSFGLERFTPDSQLYTINRSVVVRTLIPSGEFPESFARDIGVQADGRLWNRVRYAVGLFGGSGANRSIHGIGPMVTSRTTVDLLRGRMLYGQPLKLTVGGAVSVRNAKDLSFGTRGTEVTRDALAHFRGIDRRFGLEARADWGGTSFRGEYIRANFDFRDPGREDITASGYYVQLAQFLAPKWQVTTKWEAFDPNRAVTNSKDLRWWTLGLNYYIRKNRLKVMANYVFRWERANSRPNNMFLVQFQWFVF